MKISGWLLVMMTLGLGVAAETAPQEGRTAARTPPNPPKGELQRSAEILNFKRLADSGSERGKEIYFFKCWVCHNAYTRAVGTTAPTLKDLYRRTMLVTTGQPVTDQTVAGKIRNGGPGMPGYQYALHERDLADLVSFFREGKCCWEDSEEHNPPRNSRFRAPVQ